MDSLEEMASKIIFIRHGDSLAQLSLPDTLQTIPVERVEKTIRKALRISNDFRVMALKELRRESEALGSARVVELSDLVSLKSRSCDEYEVLIRKYSSQLDLPDLDYEPKESNKKGNLDLEVSVGTKDITLTSSESVSSGSLDSAQFRSVEDGSARAYQKSLGIHKKIEIEEKHEKSENLNRDCLFRALSSWREIKEFVGDKKSSKKSPLKCVFVLNKKTQFSSSSNNYQLLEPLSNSIGCFYDPLCSSKHQFFSEYPLVVVFKDSKKAAEIPLTEGTGLVLKQLFEKTSKAKFKEEVLNRLRQAYKSEDIIFDETSSEKPVNSIDAIR